MREVVVTGMGAVSALGADAESAFANAIAGRGGIRPHEVFAQGGSRLSITCPAAPVAEGACNAVLERYGSKRLAIAEPFGLFAAAATHEAVEQAGLDGDPALERAAIVYGSASGGNATIESGYQRLFERGTTAIHPLTIPRYMGSAAVSTLSMLFGIQGLCLAISSACASSAHAVIEAAEMIRAGRSDIVIAGGSDGSLTYGSLRGWQALQAMATDTCRPFSAGRQGMVVGEGAATLILESAEHAEARGAEPLARVLGAGIGSDARHLTQPDTASAIRVIGDAHARSGVALDAPVLLSAHGTGTRLNDEVESAAFIAVYGEALTNNRVIATKSAHGHMLGASGAMELLLLILAMRRGQLPPTLGFLNPDPACRIPLVTAAEQRSYRYGLSTSLAFGGLNAAILVDVPFSGGD